MASQAAVCDVRPLCGHPVLQNSAGGEVREPGSAHRILLEKEKVEASERKPHLQGHRTKQRLLLALNATEIDATAMGVNVDRQI